MFLQTHERGWWTKPNPNANPKLGQRDQRAPSAAALTRVSDFMGKDKKKKNAPTTFATTPDNKYILVLICTSVYIFI